MACTLCQNLFTLIMENENTYYLLGRRNPYIIGRRRKAPGTSHYHERHGTGTPLAGKEERSETGDTIERRTET